MKEVDKDEDNEISFKEFKDLMGGIHKHCSCYDFDHYNSCKNLDGPKKPSKKVIDAKCPVHGDLSQYIGSDKEILSLKKLKEGASPYKS